MLRLLCSFGLHKWDGTCVCRREGCGQLKPNATEADHEWDGCRCSRCRKLKPDAAESDHEWDGCKCRRCPADKHVWHGCSCSSCGTTRHAWVRGRCSRCGEYENDQSRRAATIIAEGGPRSREEYYFLFPEACPKCGSRNHIRTSYIHQDINYSGSYIVSETYHEHISCTECNNKFYEANTDTTRMPYGIRPEECTETITVDSPFLSEEEAKRIPPWKD